MLNDQKETVGQWLLKIKTEGDKLKEKAEKWDNYLVDASRVPESAYEALDKLEAIKKWKYGILLRMPLIGNQGHISRSDLDELEKILEAEA